MCACKVMDVLMRWEESFHSIYGIQVRNKNTEVSKVVTCLQFHRVTQRQRGRIINSRPSGSRTITLTQLTTLNSFFTYFNSHNILCMCMLLFPLYRCINKFRDLNYIASEQHSAPFEGLLLCSTLANFFFLCLIFFKFMQTPMTPLPL